MLFLAQKNLGEPGFPGDHCFLPTQLSQGRKVDKILQFDSRVAKKQHPAGHVLSSSNLEPKLEGIRSFAIALKEKTIYVLKRNTRLDTLHPEDLEDGKVEGDTKGNDIHEICCFHEVSERSQGQALSRG